MSDDPRWHKPTPEQYEAWGKELNRRQALYNAIPWQDESRKDERQKAWMYFRDAYNQCPECGSHENEVLNYDMMWHDGDIVCTKCRCYVRGFDAG